MKSLDRQLQTSCLFCALLLALTLATSMAYAAETTAPPDPTDNIGWVTRITGTATINRAWGELVTDVTEGTPIYLDDEIKTSPESNVTVQLDDDSILSVGEASRLRVTSWVYDQGKRTNSSYFKLLSGMARGVLNNLYGGKSKMSFETPTALTGVKGSDITVWIEDEESAAAVNEGRGYIRHRDKRYDETYELEAGFMATAAPGRAITKPFAITEKVRKRIKRLHALRNKELIERLREKRKNLREKLKKKRKGLRERIKGRFKSRGGAHTQPKPRR